MITGIDKATIVYDNDDNHNDAHHMKCDKQKETKYDD